MKAMFTQVAGIYMVVLTQTFGWLVAIGVFATGAGVIASLFGGTTSTNDNLVTGIWIAIIVGSPVAIAATVIGLRRYLRNAPWPTFDRTARMVVTLTWLVMAVITSSTTGSLVTGLPWYGSIAMAIWGVAPFVFRLAPTGR